MRKISTVLFVAVLMLLGATNAMAQFTNGKVYRIVCSGTPSVSLGSCALSDVAALSTNETDRAQQWYVTGSNGKYTFRNLANGRYLLGHKNYSNEWRLTEESNEFTVDQVNGNYAIYQTSHGTYYTYMHKDGSNNIVSWESSAANSQWTPIEVSYTAAQLQAVWDEVESFVLTEDVVKGYEEKLMAIFTDKACTQLNSTYASKSVSQIEADANYQALPAVLQAMVLKVKNNDWSEANAVSSKPQWGSDYAKKFRVQMYEPYSIEGEITSYLRINAHCNMDNPTGLYANSGKSMYIMVEGEIKEGAELWVAYQTGLGATSYYNNASYTQLREGLNVVPYFDDTSSLWINYVVHTYNSNGTTIAEKFPHKLSDYKPLKIHIEGGYINGYYNAIGDFRSTDSGTENLWGDVDNDEDWNYYMKRAPLDGDEGRPNRDFPLLAHRQTLLFPLGPVQDDGGVTRAGLYHRIQNIVVPSVPNCYGGSGHTSGTYAGSYPGMGLSTSNGKINIMLEAWDRIMYSQLASMGVVSKSTMDKMNALYPRWTSAGTHAEIYDYNNRSSLDNKTYLEFCQGIDYSEYFNHHGCGVGWPNGYMSGGWRVTAYHYETMEGIIGTIASSSGSTWGPAHEIGHQHQSIINLEGQTEVTNNFFSNVAVWYMGMATSRYDGSQGSLESVLGAFTTEDSDLYTNNIWAMAHLYYRLWLYYHLAGNNTQFWPRLFELCRQVPLENHPNGTNDGSATLLRFYQHACDAAGEDLTEFFRAHGYFEVMNNRVVGDYYGATYNQTQAQIDAAIQSVKAKKYPANYAVLLINDGTNTTTFKHDGATRRNLWDGYATAEFGSVNDFVSGNVDVTTNYEARLDSDGSITMTGGQGGVGFIMFNKNNGELVAFSNKSTFKLGKEAKELYQSGGATIAVVNADNDIVWIGDEIVLEPDEPTTDPEDPSLDTKKTELQALIAATNELIGIVGAVTEKPKETVILSESNVYCNATIAEGAMKDLFDNDAGSFIHTQWSGKSADSDYHYLRVDMGDGASIGEFSFTYTTASRDYEDMPKTIVVEGANNIDGDNSTKDTFTEIATLTDSELPHGTKQNIVYNSSILGSASASYRYLRFRVTAMWRGTDTGDITDDNGYPFFTMAEFGLAKAPVKTIVVKDEYLDSKVTNDLLLAIQNEVKSAERVLETASSLEELTGQISDLRAAKASLEDAMNTEGDFKLAALRSLYNDALALYSEMSENGKVNGEYAQSGLTDEMLSKAKSAIDVAMSNLDNPKTQDEIDDAEDALQIEYDSLLAIKNTNVADRKDLEDLIDSTNALIESAATINISETTIALQCENANAPYYIYCNASGSTNNYDGDYDGVAAMLDVDKDGKPVNTTHLHTTYTGNGYDDDLDHYLRIDMGENEALASFKFEYYPRSGNTNNSPKKILVEGCNDLAKGVFEEIAIIADSNMDDSYYESGVITNGKAYRYIRLMVKETFNNAKYNGHPYFVLSHFGMTACKTIALKDEFKSSNLSISTLAGANNEMADADVVKNKSYVSQTVYNAALGELQTAYNLLNSAMQFKDFPVLLTTNAEKPILYKIKINRDGNKYLQYDEASAKVAVGDDRQNRALAWYFMIGDDVTKDVLIIPYKDNNKVLATNSFSEGADKVDAVEKTTTGYSYNWNITKVADSEWYNITMPNGNGTTFYFSNYGGVGEKMGFYNKSTDGGSQFKFILDETEYTLPDSYYELADLHQNCGGEKSFGTGVFQYTKASAETYNEMNSRVKSILEKAEMSEEEYAEEYEKLLSAYNALELNVPVKGACYRIRSACSSSDRSGQIIYVNAENKPYFASPGDENLSEYIWQFEPVDGGYYLKSMHTQSYISTAGWGEHVQLDSKASKITIDVLDNGANGAVRMNVSGGSPLHAQANGSVLVGYSGGLNSASSWYVEEVVKDDVHYSYKLNAVGYGTLMLGFDVAIPEGVGAYYAESLSGVNINLVSFDNVIPANTPVILKSTEKLENSLDLDFKYSATSASSADGNMLAGTLYKRVVKCDTDKVNNNVYVMQVKDGVVKMYWAYENYDADGKKVTDENGSTNNDLGGYIMNSANRAYLVVPQADAKQASIFNLRFNDLVTDVEGVDADAGTVEAIYDLQGRKLESITKPGIYIVNGKRVFVK